MKDYGQMATSMPDGFRVEAVDTVTTTGQRHPSRIQAQESIGDLRQLCLMGRAFYYYDQLRCSTLAIDAQSSMF